MIGQGTTMTTIKHNIDTASLKTEVRQIRKAAQKVAASKATAIRFLESTGMHDSDGQLKPRFR
jgi:hypothetical protein